jgi:lysophospholipase L1-like esterase
MKTLVIGDSWASAIEADTGLDGGWPLMMGLAPEMRLGVSGSTAAQWAADKNGWLTMARQTEADAVMVSLLGNDARHAVSDGRVTADEIAAGLRDMRAVVEAVQRPLTIVLLYADPFCGDQAQARVGVPLLNGAIRWACNGLQVVFADTGAWLTRAHFDGRDIHPTRAGHTVIAEKMRDLCTANPSRLGTGHLVHGTQHGVVGHLDS